MMGKVKTFRGLILAVAVVLFTTACDKGVCTQYVDTSELLVARSVECKVFDSPSERPDDKELAACDEAGVENCNDDDQRRIGMLEACVEQLPDCTRETYDDWMAEAAICVAYVVKVVNEQTVSSLSSSCLSY